MRAVSIAIGLMVLMACISVALAKDVFDHLRV